MRKHSKYSLCCCERLNRAALSDEELFWWRNCWFDLVVKQQSISTVWFEFRVGWKKKKQNKNKTRRLQHWKESRFSRESVLLPSRFGQRNSNNRFLIAKISLFLLKKKHTQFKHLIKLLFLLSRLIQFTGLFFSHFLLFFLSIFNVFFKIGQRTNTHRFVWLSLKISLKESEISARSIVCLKFYDRRARAYCHQLN